MKKITFGRLQDNDIIFDHESVSRHHGYLLVDRNKIYVVDDNSLNGISVNGKRIQEKAELSYGDKVLVANLFNLDWRRYAPVREAEKTVLNDKSSPQPEKKPDWKKSFWKTAGNILKYIVTTVVTLAVMALINKWLR